MAATQRLTFYLLTAASACAATILILDHFAEHSILTRIKTYIILIMYFMIDNGKLLIDWVLVFKARRLGLGCPRGVMVKAMDCGIVVCEFEL